MKQKTWQLYSVNKDLSDYKTWLQKKVVKLQTKLDKLNHEIKGVDKRGKQASWDYVKSVASSL